MSTARLIFSDSTKRSERLVNKEIGKVTVDEEEKDGAFGLESVRFGENARDHIAEHLHRLYEVDEVLPCLLPIGLLCYLNS